jgi:glycosyltransferase involved in cell wall biosynthesis
MIEDRTPSKCCHVGVDLTLMMPAGGNGGIKPAILTFLQSLEERFRDRVRFSFLTNSSTYQDVEFLVRKQDKMICVAVTHGFPWPIVDSRLPNFTICREFTPATLIQLGIDVFYCPFGPTDRSHPDIPTVSLVTDLLHRDYPFSIPDSERHWREAYFKKILTDADYVQCISRYTVDRLHEYYSVSKDQVFCTHLPIDQRLEARADLAPERPYFIYPANFWVHKNHEILLIAYRIYRQAAIDPWDVVLTGNPDGRGKEIQELAKLLQVETNVRFAGHLDEDSFADLLAGAGALVYPSLHEGFGIPLVEAMRFRKPIISSKSASIPEVAGDAAIYVDGKSPLELATAMSDLTRDPALRSRLVLKGEERLRTFSIAQEVDKLYDIFAIAKHSNSLIARCVRRLKDYGKLSHFLFKTTKG